MHIWYILKAYFVFYAKLDVYTHSTYEKSVVYSYVTTSSKIYTTVLLSSLYISDQTKDGQIF